ncbi:TIR domain-containing protein [Gemmiger formicilis]|jgi:TPR repeat protein|uniref:TIR domain-containing protein n=1 Tax=Gemmiger formicilis TaxID=745368 RepID=UPI0022E3158F|nr:TIR domain-containing protein [Gemmiger formicilis]
MQRCNAEPYEGNQPYLFVSYSHKEEDKAIVYPILERMEQAGFRVWFDQGIEATSEWPSAVCAHLKASSACLFCLSPNFADSVNCRDELYLAKKEAIKRVTLFLKSDMQLDPELEMGLVRQEQLFLENYSDIEELIKHLKQDENLQSCLGASAPARKSMGFTADCIRKELQDKTFLSAKQAYQNREFKKAMNLYRAAYTNGNSTAGTLLGEMYDCGNYCPHDDERAAKIFVDCMHRNNPLAAEHLAGCYKYGRGVPKDEAKASSLFAECQDALEEMAILGSNDAQYHLGYDFLNGEFSDAVPERGLYWLRKALAAGYTLAGYDLAVAKINGNGCPKDVDAGIEELNRYTKDLDCAYFTAQLLQEGIDGREPNEKEAFDLLLYAAENGHISAQGYLGDCYYFGNGTAVDYAESLRWHQKAAANGDTDSLNALGLHYLLAEGVPQDIKKAISFFDQTDEKGYPLGFGSYMLGRIYCGLPDGCQPYKDLVKAVRFLQKATDSSDNLDPIKLLLQCYHGDFGREVQDMSKYYAAMQKAADLGDTQSMYDMGCALMDGSREPLLSQNIEKGIELINKAAMNDHYGALLMQAKMAITANPPQKEKWLLLLQRANKVFDHFDFLSLSADTLCKLGDLCLSIAFPGYSIESLADTNIEILTENYPKQQTQCFQNAYVIFSFALSCCDSLHALLMVAFIRFLAEYKDTRWDDAVLLERLKKEAGNDRHIPVLLAAYYEKNRQDEEMIYWLKVAAKKNISSVYRLGRYCVKNRTHGEDAMQVLMPLKNFKDPEACYLLGCLYRYGIGVEKNRSEAKALLRIAAKNGSKDAAADLKTFWF